MEKQNNIILDLILLLISIILVGTTLQQELEGRPNLLLLKDDWGVLCIKQKRAIRRKIKSTYYIINMNSIELDFILLFFLSLVSSSLFIFSISFLFFYDIYLLLLLN